MEQASLQQQPTKAGSRAVVSRGRSWSLLGGFLLLWGLKDSAFCSARVALAKLAELQGYWGHLGWPVAFELSFEQAWVSDEGDLPSERRQLDSHGAPPHLQAQSCLMPLLLKQG